MLEAQMILLVGEDVVEEVKADVTAGAADSPLNARRLGRGLGVVTAISLFMATAFRFLLHGHQIGIEGVLS